MVELLEMAEGVLETSDHLGTRPDRFPFEIVLETCFNLLQIINFGQG